MAEEDGFASRAKRLARTTRTVGGLAAKLASERYLGRTINREIHASELRDAIGNLKGPLMKVAQILATIPDALPDEYDRKRIASVPTFYHQRKTNEAPLLLIKENTILKLLE